MATKESQWLAAETALEESLALCRAMPHPYAEAKSLYFYGLTYLAQHEPEGARERLTAALVIVRQLGEGLYSVPIEQALSKLETA
jgi:hypothetical protein